MGIRRHHRIRKINPNKFLDLNSGRILSKIDVDILKQQENYDIFKHDYNKENYLDCTFIIPFKIDFPERLMNLKVILEWILKHFKTNIIIIEQDIESNKEKIWLDKWNDSVKYVFVKEEEGFHKSRLLNIGYNLSETEICVPYDVDCLLKPEQYLNSIQIMKDKKINFLYPFNKPIRQIERTNIENIFTKDLDEISLKTINKILPPGGCFFLNKKRFKEIGFENENYISYGPEDAERKLRIEKIEKIHYLDGYLYHIKHPQNNIFLTKYVENNHKMYEEMKKMNDEEFKNYVEKLYEKII
jgi:hypothetical protein